MSLPFYIFNKVENQDQEKKKAPKVKPQGITLNFQKDNTVILRSLVANSFLEPDDFTFMTEHIDQIQYLNIVMLALVRRIIDYCRENGADPETDVKFFKAFKALNAEDDDVLTKSFLYLKKHQENLEDENFKRNLKFQLLIYRDIFLKKFND